MKFMVKILKKIKNIEKNQNIYYVDKYSSKKDIHIKRIIRNNINNELEYNFIFNYI